MRRATVALLAATALLSACGGKDADGDTASTSPTPSTPSASAPSTPKTTNPAPSTALSPEMREQVFVTFLEKQGFIPQYMTGEVAVQLADALCGRYDGGASYEDVVGVLLDGGIEPFAAGGFEGAAVTAFCPEHANKRTGEPAGA